MLLRMRHGFAVGLLSLGLASSGCGGATYRQDQAAEAIRQICAAEYRLRVSVKQAGGTVAVHLDHPGTLMQLDHQQVWLNPAANELLGNVMEVIHRVVLSTEPPMDFYLLLVSDPAVPGAYFSLVRYLDDVRRVNANMIPPTEFFSRTILELKLTGTPGVSLDQLSLHTLTLEQFLSLQLAQRIQAHLAEQVNAKVLPTIQVGPCEGEFRNGEFTFALNVAPQPGVELNEALLHEIFDDATGVIARVLAGYRFERFETIRLIHPLTGRNLLLPKAQLQVGR